jgi:hypothetical protein
MSYSIAEPPSRPSIAALPVPVTALQLHILLWQRELVRRSR